MALHGFVRIVKLKRAFQKKKNTLKYFQAKCFQPTNILTLVKHFRMKHIEVK